MQTLPAQPASTAIPEPPAFPALQETPSPDAYLNAGFWGVWGIWIILAAALLLVAAAAFFIIRKNSRKPVAPLTAAQTALRDIDVLRNMQPPLKQAAVDLSLILRKFLVGETSDPALYETQQEFNRRANALTALPAKLQIPTRELLDRMADLKYEPDTRENASLVNELADRTVQLINDIETAARAVQQETDLVVGKSSARTNKS